MLIASFLLAGTLAGCTSSDQPGDDADHVRTAALFIDGDRCMGTGRNACSLEGGILHVRDLRLEPGDDDETAIRIWELTVPLVIENVETKGFTEAMYIADTCATCSVEIRDSVLGFVFNGIRTGPGATPAPIIIRDTVLRGDPPEAPPYADENETIIVGTHAIIMDGNPFDLVVQNISVETTRPSAGVAIWSREGPARLEASGLRIAGYDRAISGIFTRVVLNDSAIQCDYSALRVSSPKDGRPTEVLVDGLVITGCKACRTDDCLANAVFITSLSEVGGTAIFRNLTMVDNWQQLWIQGYHTVRLEEFVIENGYAAAQIWAYDVALVNGTVRDHPGAGVYIGTKELSIDRVTFQRNGFRDLGDGLHVYRISQAETRPMKIHNSSFEGNLAYGIQTPLADTAPIDASNNWWGHPMGPIRAPYSKSTLFEDRERAWGLTLITDPFLTAPP